MAWRNAPRQARKRSPITPALRITRTLSVDPGAAWREIDLRNSGSILDDHTAGQIRWTSSKISRVTRLQGAEGRTGKGEKVGRAARAQDGNLVHNLVHNKIKNRSKRQQSADCSDGDRRLINTA